MFIKRLAKFLFVFVILTICFISIFININILILATAPQCQTHLVASFLDKQNNLQRASSPRIIIVGDSATAYGIDSQKIVDAFSRPTINLGVTGLLSMAFSIETTKQYIEPDDIVIVSFTNIQLTNSPQFGSPQFNAPRPSYIWRLLTLNLSEIQNITTIEQVSAIIQANIISIRDRINDYVHSETNSCGYKRRFWFNEHGDLVRWLEEESPGKDFSDYDLGDMSIEPHLFDSLNDYASYVKEQGASIYFLPTVMSQTVYINHQKEFQHYEQSLQKNLDFPIIGHIEDFVLPDSMIYDEIYHATGEGRQIYTKQMITRLEQLLSQE